MVIHATKLGLAYQREREKPVGVGADPRFPAPAKRRRRRRSLKPRGRTWNGKAGARHGSRITRRSRRSGAGLGGSRSEVGPDRNGTPCRTGCRHGRAPRFPPPMARRAPSDHDRTEGNGWWRGASGFWCGGPVAERCPVMAGGAATWCGPQATPSRSSSLNCLI